ncbi:GIY-YIG nuclease family protein [Argonema antarcticum]|uniref:GIY-YIG nuclease family protein n=1 Tax=Argonema antarcticum TaxID=2942763 RepID=UPI002011369E|nr:GIY-YIG nuclease family protein [Argonema antarcticum]MCL1473221.1 GIY-YIG nuclease family protein [Argonema antarcticum A004/B2]
MTNFPIFVGQFTLRQRHQLPDNPGIYFVIDERDQLLYIGQAKSLKSRWSGGIHHRYKQFSRKGLDKIVIRYILTSVSELDRLEREYIDRFKPLLNDSKVKQYLPKTSPRFSELQRLLKLTSKPLFPSVLYTSRDGETIPREAWALFRGFVAGVYQENQPHIIVVCQQNMGSILWKSSSDRTKKRFYIETDSKYLSVCYLFDARQAILVFVELFDPDLAEPIFKEVYPNLVDFQIAGVMVKKLINPNLLMSALQKSTFKRGSAAQDYLLSICGNLQTLPADINLNQQIMW